MTRLLLVRHGQTPSNVLGLLDTALPGPGLTDLGTRQAAELIESLADEVIEYVVTSAARRAIETATPFSESRGLEIDSREGLREVQAGGWEMSGAEDDIVGYMRTIRAWMDGDLDERTPGPTGESGRDVLARFDEVVEQVVRANPGRKTVLLVAHGAVLRFWATYRSTNVDPAFSSVRVLRNTGLIVLEGEPASGWQCLSWTDAPPESLGITEPLAESGPAADPIPAP